MKKWIKIPGPGQYRGQGEWEEVTEPKRLDDYNYCLETGYLPVAESDEKPEIRVDTSETTS